MQIGTRLDHIRAFMERRSGRQLVFEYCTPTGEEQMGNLEEMTADNGANGFSACLPLPFPILTALLNTKWGECMNSIKSRIAALQAIAAQKQTGVAIMTLLENGAWEACRAPQSLAKVFQTEQAARDYLSDCDSIIIIDL